MWLEDNFEGKSADEAFFIKVLRRLDRPGSLEKPTLYTHAQSRGFINALACSLVACTDDVGVPYACMGRLVPSKTNGNEQTKLNRAVLSHLSKE